MKTQKQIQDEWVLECMLYSTKQALMHEMPIKSIEPQPDGMLVTLASGHKFKFTIESVEDSAVKALLSEKYGSVYIAE